jgi:hypothetical protein
MLLLVCAYPMLRTFDLIPVHHIADAANSVSAERKSSFQTRVENEDILLAKGNQKPLFGWGAGGRNRVYRPGTGEDMSITDGEWTIQFGAWGWFGYLSFFGLFAAAVYRARAFVRGPVTQDSIVVAGLSLVVAINILDMVPNAFFVPFTYLAAGSVAGVVRVRSARKMARPVTASSRPAIVAH